MSSSNVSSKQRFTHGRRCPICGGADNDPRGKEKRCHGYVSSDGLYAHCTREELAGGISRHDKSEAFPHKLSGPCACGVTHMQADRNATIEAEYNYVDETGKLLFQAVRMIPKTFRQRRPDGVGGWIWNLQDTRRVLYRLPELLAADRGAPVFIVEGEKDVDTLRSHGFVATCNPMGAKKFHFVKECSHEVLADRHIVIIPDADDDGRKHGDQVEAIVRVVAASVRRFEMPGAKDVSDWFGAGGTAGQLEVIRAATPPSMRVARDEPFDSDDTFADRDQEPPPQPKKKLVGRTWADCVEEIYARKDEPWIEIRICDAVIATCRNGSFVPLVAPSGAGKSSLALQMIVDHAMHRGPAVYLTYELDGDEAVARAIGQQCAFSWAAVLRGEVPRANVPSVSRLRILERDDANLENLAKVCAELAAEFPNQPVLVVSDYIQATPAPPGKERGFTANVSVELRRAAKKIRVVIIGISQASTDNSKKMRDGELLGIDGSATGAETAQIERDAYVILTLGDRQNIDPDTVSWKLSTAKYRLGLADVVHELHYRGRIGTWEVIGEPKSARDVIANRNSEMKAKKIAELKRSITALVTGSKKPLSKKEITAVSTGRDGVIHDAIKELLREGVLVHMHGARKGGAALIWTPEKQAQQEMQT